MRYLPLLAAGAFAVSLPLAGAAFAQDAAPPAKSAAAAPDFDVSTVKSNNTGSRSIRVSITDDMLRADNAQIDMLMETAFGVRRNQIVGLPHWAEVNHYDVTAKIVDMTAEQRKGLNKAQRQATLQKLLAERFHLQTHVEKRTLPLLELVIAKGGIKFTEFKEPAPGDADKHGGSMSMNNTEMNATGVALGDLVNFLSDQTRMPVLDKTGLTARYDLHLKWQREEEGPQSGVRDETLPTLYTALQEQLGLRLESGKGAVDVLVVDHIDPPEEN